MNRQMLRSPDQKCLFASMLNHKRRCIAVISLLRRLVIASDFPHHVARRFVKRGKPGLTVVHARHDDILLRQYWRCTVVPIQRVLPETFDQIRLPADRSIQVHRSQRATLKIHK